MSAPQIILYCIGAFCTLAWLLYLLRAAYHGSAIKLLRDQTSPLTYEPKVSVILAARNEEALIEHSLRSILATSYPHIEMIAVDDRSTDATGAIIDRLALQDPRLTAIHIDHLPQGWLGKVHALNAGSQQATGDWLLFTDADIHFEPEAITKAIAFAESKDIDHLAVIPTDRTQHKDFLLPLFVFAFGGLFVQRARAAEIGMDESTAFIGVGAFNLVRKSTFDRTPGFEWLKMEVIDDVGIGYLIKRIGGRAALLSGEGLLSFEWYFSIKDAIKGLEKNAFAGFARYNVLRGLLLVLGMWCVVLLPLVVGIVYGDLLVIGATLFFYSLLPMISSIVLRKGIPIKPLHAASLPLGYFFISLAILNSVLSGWISGGLRWRETFYSLDELKKGQRVRI